MTQNKTAYFLVGAFVLSMLGILIVLLTLLAGGGGEADHYVTRYPNVAGLKFGTPVFFEGFRAGQIESIEPETSDGRTDFKVTVSILSELRVPDDSLAQIIQPNLLSGRAISIAAGSSKTFLPPGGEITGGTTAGLAALPDMIGSGRLLIGQGHELLAQTTSAMTHINAWLETDFPRIARQYETLPATLETQTVIIGGLLEDLLTESQVILQRTEKLLSEANIATVSRTLENVESTAARLEQVSQDLLGLNDNLQAITTQIKDFVADNKTDMDASVVDLRYTLSMVAQRIDAMTYNMEGASRNMYEFSRQIRLNPGLLLGGTPPTDEARANE